METFTFFWKEKEKNGEHSQWYPSPFVIEGVQYNRAEQYMMAEKARMFQDLVALGKILTSNSPHDQKKYGRGVKGFDANKWNAVVKEIVYAGNYAKYSQNLELKKRLLDTTGTTLVEASPLDKIWGIGLAEDDPRAHRRETWLGTNWLGEVLTRLREDFDKNSPCCRKCWEKENNKEAVGLGDILLNPIGMPFIVCSICGNKRCPHATDHNLACTNSNAPGQEGSIYYHGIGKSKRCHRS